MNYISYKNASIAITGVPVNIGEQARQFSLTSVHFSPVTLEHFEGNKLIIYTFPSVDSTLCANTIREFNLWAMRFKYITDITVLCVSIDTPFALIRFIESEGLDYIKFASCYHSPIFMHDYNTLISDSIFTGFSARAVICINEKSKIQHHELISHLFDEPDYSAAFKSLIK
ncbi:thiol peroxidase [Photobacterium indicum]|uniref:thiol peroxidase n=1 Tax=Photobacterium indicum TaxID=81447 RepID=UPI003D135D15